MPKKREFHLHSYVRVKGRPDYYMCSAPNCSHYIHKNFLAGKQALCPICLDSYIIGSEQFRLVRMRCNECRRGKPKGSSLEAISKKLDKLFEEEIVN